MLRGTISFVFGMRFCEEIIRNSEQMANQTTTTSEESTNVDTSIAVTPNSIERTTEGGTDCNITNAGEDGSRHSKQRVTAVGHEVVRSNLELETLRQLYLPKDPTDRIVHADGTVSFLHAKSFLPVRMLRPSERQRILVTGGAGFVGSHLVDRLMLMGHEVIVMDNFFTGTKTNVQHWIGHPHFDLVRHDVVDPFMIEVNQIYHLACPASPPHYQYNPTKTVKTSVMGTINMLGLAKRTKARFLLTSTSGKNNFILKFIARAPHIHVKAYWQRFTVIQKNIHKKRPIGVMSIPLGHALATMKANALLKH
jgi:hypothetical protein